MEENEVFNQKKIMNSHHVTKNQRSMLELRASLGQQENLPENFRCTSPRLNKILPCHFELLPLVYATMTTFTNPTTNFHAEISTPKYQFRPLPTLIRATFSGDENRTQRRKFVTTLLATSIIVVGLNNGTTPLALAENWGTRSFLRERFFEPGLSPEDAVARIRQTAQGLHSIRNMLETMSWRYVLFYIRLKAAYLSQDMKNAMTTLPESRRKSYVKTANELVDNMSEFDYYVRTPKVYESYLYYEKTLKSIDELVALL